MICVVISSEKVPVGNDRSLKSSAEKKIEIL